MSFGRLEQDSAPQPMSEINMTPLIDVMLVLMVIFMITAPLLNASLKLDLPKVDAAPSEPLPQTLSLSIDAQGRFFMDNRSITPQALDAALGQVARLRPDTEVQLSSDQNAKYGRAAELIALLQKHGLTRIGLVTDVLSAPAGEPAASR